MTSHHDVAGVVASASGYRGDKTIVERLREAQPSLNRVHQDRKDAALALESQAKALSEAETLAFRLNSGEELQSLMRLNNELLARALAAEARLAEAMKVIERDMEALTEADTQIEYLHDKFKPTVSGANTIARIDIALTAACAFTNAAKEKTDAS